MTLTATQILVIRRVIGDNDSAANSGSYYLTDTEIQTEYTRANGNDVLCYIFCLQQLLGLVRVAIDSNSVNGYGNNISRSQLFTQTKTLLDYWLSVWKNGDYSLVGGESTNNSPSQIGLVDLALDQTIS